MVAVGLSSFADNAKQLSNFDVSFDRHDLMLKPPGFALTQKPPANLPNQLFWAKQGTNATFNVTGSTPFQFQKSFFLADVFDSANFQKVFDQYCIYAIAISFTPVTSTALASYGTIYTIIDYSDIISVSSSSEALSYSTSRSMVLAPGSSHLRVFKPCVSQSLYQTSVLTGYGPTRAWIDIASPSIPHFGIKAYVDGTSSNITVNVNTEYLIGFRSTK